MLVNKQSKGYHMRHDIPNLKRLWFCQQKYEKTTGCVCDVCECQSILNIPITEIDALRSEKRSARQRKNKWKFTLDIDYAQLESRFYQSRAMKQMIVSREEMLRLSYGGPRPSPIFDQVILDESVHLLPLGQISRETFDTIWTSPPKEGKPKDPKPWQKLIPDNRKLKPR